MPVAAHVEPAHHLGQPPDLTGGYINPTRERLGDQRRLGHRDWQRRQHRLGHDDVRQHRVGHAAATATTSSGAPPSDGDNIVWGTSAATTSCGAPATATTSSGAPASGDNIVWGTERRRRRQHRVGHGGGGDNIVWGTPTAATTSCGAPSATTTTSSGARSTATTSSGAPSPRATTSCGAPRATATTSCGARPTTTTSSGALPQRQHRVGHRGGGQHRVGDRGGDNIVWGTADDDNIVWAAGSSEAEQRNGGQLTWIKSPSLLNNPNSRPAASNAPGGVTIEDWRLGLPCCPPVKWFSVKCVCRMRTHWSRC